MCYIGELVEHLFSGDGDKFCFNHIAFITRTVDHLDLESGLFYSTITKQKQTWKFNIQLTLYRYLCIRWRERTYIEAIKCFEPDVTYIQGILFRIFKSNITISIFVGNTDAQYIFVLPDGILRDTDQPDQRSVGIRNI